MTCANDRCRLPVVHDGRCDERVASAESGSREALEPSSDCNRSGVVISAGASAAGEGDAAAPPQPADDLVQRAAEVIHRSVRPRCVNGCPFPDCCYSDDYETYQARALVNAGLLHDGPKLTDAEQAVLEAAVEWFEWKAAHAADGGPHDPRDGRLYRLLADPETRAAVRAKRAAR